MLDSHDLRARMDAAYAEAWKDYDSAACPDEIYHYTSLEGMTGILTRRVLFASDILCMNDASELAYAQTLVREVLGQRSDQVSEAIREAFDSGLVLPGLGTAWSVHIACLCTERDLLSQWRGYAGRTGYAIGFQRAAMAAAALGNAAAEVALLRMLYDEGQQRRVIHVLLEESIRTLRGVPRWSKDGGQVPLADRVLGQIDLVLGEISLKLLLSMFRFKHPGFLEEDEWRLLILVRNDTGALTLKYRFTAMGLVPYVEFPLKAEWVTRVVQGPGLAPRFNERAVTRMLLASGYSQDIFERSRIPLSY